MLKKKKDVTYIFNKASLLVCVCFLINHQDNQGISVVMKDPHTESELNNNGYFWLTT